MAKEIEQLWNKFSLGEEEEVTIIGDTIDELEARKKGESCFLGKILSPKKVNLNAMISTMRNVWNLHKGSHGTILGKNVVYKLPLNRMNKSTAKVIGNNEDVAWERYLRIRVIINIAKPLLKGMKFMFNGEECSVFFRYERLPNFCYTYGKIGHVEKECDLHWKDSFIAPDCPRYKEWLCAAFLAEGGATLNREIFDNLQGLDVEVIGPFIRNGANAKRGSVWESIDSLQSSASSFSRSRLVGKRRNLILIIHSYLMTNRDGKLSGFSWNPFTKPWCAEPEVWEQLISEKLEAIKWRNKVVNNYHSLEELFAKDRAMGQGAKTAKEKHKCWISEPNGMHLESIVDIDQLLSHNQISLENFDCSIKEFNEQVTTPSDKNDIQVQYLHKERKERSQLMKNLIFLNAHLAMLLKHKRGKFCTPEI
ncbi:hypothetical protein ACH5RR_013043 [Cinchona calisaya]|uniref:Zinc knuckle CX2CX4HX4C domain-containing protein n=1 Tax=Cinchona calisaya TaxID=153742 RepID=A0ABD2ZYY4_9GENT